MHDNKPRPGITREARIDAEGLQRLERHLQRGARIGPVVLAQWIKRYGDAARELLRKYGQYDDKLE